jgi:hypothetical protein
MATYQRRSDRDPIIEVSSKKEEEEEEFSTSNPIYDDTIYVIDKDIPYH